MLTDEQRRGIVACLRNKLGFSLSDIARAAGVNPSTVHAWLTGRAAPQADKLERLYSAMPETVERCPPTPFGELEVMQALSVIDKALKTVALRDRLIEGLSKILPGGLKREVTYRAELEDVGLFRSKLAAEGGLARHRQLLRAVSGQVPRRGGVGSVDGDATAGLHN